MPQKPQNNNDFIAKVVPITTKSKEKPKNKRKKKEKKWTKGNFYLLSILRGDFKSNPTYPQPQSYQGFQRSIRT
jgi:hypothetical protein